MSIKTIVAIIQTEEDSERVLSCALPLAKRFGALLIGVHATTVPMAYGSDLLGQLHKYQSIEFTTRNKVLPAADIIESATLISAKLCRMEGKVGELSAGAFADLLVVDGNPLEDISVLEQHDRLKAIMKGGHFYKNELAA